MKGRPFFVMLIMLVLSAAIIAAQGQIISLKMHEVVQSALERMKQLDAEDKMLEKQAQHAISTNNSGLYTRLAEKSEKIKSEKKTLHDETLTVLQGMIGQGIEMDIRQESLADVFTVKNSVIKKAVWNSGRNPHVTIEMQVLLKRKLTSAERKVPVDFFNGSGRVVRVPFYLSAGTFVFKTDKGQVVSFFANPEIPGLADAGYGVIVSE